MAHSENVADPDLLRYWVETWRRAGNELEKIRRRELQTIDTATVVRQLLESPTFHADLPLRTTSGLVEQQAWFSKLRP